MFHAIGGQCWIFCRRSPLLVYTAYMYLCRGTDTDTDTDTASPSCGAVHLIIHIHTYGLLR